MEAGLSVARVNFSHGTHEAHATTIALVRKVADRILVMEKGVIVEDGPADRVINVPGHSYTRQLLAAASERAGGGGELDGGVAGGLRMGPNSDGMISGKGVIHGLEPTSGAT